MSTNQDQPQDPPASPTTPDPIVFDAGLLSMDQRGQDLADVVRYDPDMETKIELTNPFRGNDIDE